MLFELRIRHPGVAVTTPLFMQREWCKCSNLSASVFPMAAFSDSNEKRVVTSAEWVGCVLFSHPGWFAPSIVLLIYLLSCSVQDGTHLFMSFQTNFLMCSSLFLLMVSFICVIWQYTVSQFLEGCSWFIVVFAESSSVLRLFYGTLLILYDWNSEG